MKLDYVLEDNAKTAYDLNINKVKCYLLDRPHNRHFENLFTAFEKELINIRYKKLRVKSVYEFFERIYGEDE